MGLGAFPADHPQSLYWFGMHGTVAGNWAVCDSDLLITAGARFDDRITGVVSKFAPNATIVHFDIDRAEHNKNKFAHHPIASDIKYALARLNELIAETKWQRPDISAWMTQIAAWKKQHPFPFSYAKNSEYILPQEAIEVLFEETKGDAIITTGVGQHQMWTPQYYHFKEPRTFISSLGLGTMGFGFPAALGAKVARPDKQVIDVDGDGSFLMNIQELATAKIEKINAKCLLLNNQHLGMVVQWEDNFYAGTRGHTILCDPENIGSPQQPRRHLSRLRDHRERLRREGPPRPQTRRPARRHPRNARPRRPLPPRRHRPLHRARAPLHPAKQIGEGDHHGTGEVKLHEESNDARSSSRPITTCLRCRLLVGKLWNLRAVFRVLDGDAADVAVAVQVQQGIRVEVGRLRHVHRAKLDVERVRVLKILDFHGRKERSKRALCTVLQSERKHSALLPAQPLQPSQGRFQHAADAMLRHAAQEESLEEIVRPLPRGQPHARARAGGFQINEKLDAH